MLQLIKNILVFLFQFLILSSVELGSLHSGCLYSMHEWVVFSSVFLFPFSSFFFNNFREQSSLFLKIFLNQFPFLLSDRSQLNGGSSSSEKSLLFLELLILHRGRTRPFRTAALGYPLGTFLLNFFLLLGQIPGSHLFFNSLFDEVLLPDLPELIHFHLMCLFDGHLLSWMRLRKYSMSASTLLLIQVINGGFGLFCNCVLTAVH